jgi:hypothetical protein
VAKIRLIAPVARVVPGLGRRTVQPDEVVTVPDRDFESYVCQPEIWQPVEEPKTEPRQAAMKTARRAPKDGD